MKYDIQRGQALPRNPTLSGHDYAPGSVRSSEWSVWSTGQYYAELTVFNRTPGSGRPAIMGTGTGSTPFRALFIAAAECIELRADADSVISGLSMAVTGASKLTPPVNPALRSGKKNLSSPRFHGESKLKKRDDKI